MIKWLRWLTPDWYRRAEATDELLKVEVEERSERLERHIAELEQLAKYAKRVKAGRHEKGVPGDA